MAKEIDKIIQSKTTPKSKNVLWDDGENLKINRNGKFENVNNVNFFDLKESPISINSNHKEYKYDIQQLNEVNKNGTIITGKIEEKQFNGILFYYNCGMENEDVEKGYVYMDYNEIEPETPIGPLIIFTLKEDLTYEIYTVMPLKGDYFSFQPILSINKLPSYMFENVTYITLNDSNEINSRSKGELIKINNNISLIDNIDPIYTNTYITTNGIVKNVFDGNGNFKFSFRDLGVFNDIVFSIKDNNTNLKIIKKIKSIGAIGCILWNDYDIILINATYYNGTITGIKNGLYVQYNVNQTTGEITLKHEIDVVELYNKVNSL